MICDILCYHSCTDGGFLKVFTKVLMRIRIGRHDKSCKKAQPLYFYELFAVLLIDERGVI